MKALRILAILIFILLGIYLVVPLFLSDMVIINAESDMEAKPATVFRQVNSLQNWLKWSPFEKDSTLVNQFSGPEMGVGASRTWSGEQAGKGSMTILESQPYEYIVNKLDFEPGEGDGTGSWNFTATEKGTNVVWTIRLSGLSWPNGRWMGLLVREILQPTMEEGLANLKRLTEPMPDPPAIKVVELAAQPALVIPDSATLDEMAAMMESNYQKLYTYILNRQIPIIGDRFAIYHNWDPEGITRVTTGVPVEKDTRGNKEIKYFEIPASKAVLATHIGNSNSAGTHYAIDDYLKDFNLETRGYIWEVYQYDPEKDTIKSNWVTRIYYPLK